MGLNGGITYREICAEEYVTDPLTISTKSVDELVERLKPYLSDNIALFGGHWIPESHLAKKGILSKPGNMPELSFEIAAKLYSRAVELNYSNVNFGILFGDIAFKEKKREALLTNFPFPEAYAKILSNYHVDENDVIVFSEKWLQDSANDFLKELCETTTYTSKDNHSNDLLGNPVTICSENDAKIYLYGGIPVGKVIVDPTKQSMKSTCPLIQTAEMDMASDLGVNRVIDVRDHSSFLCNEKYGMLYYMLKKQNPDTSVIEIVNASLLWEETVNKLSIKNRFWLNPEKE